MKNSTISIELADGRVSEIIIGSKLLEDAATWRRLNLSKQVAVVTNATVGELYYETLTAALPEKPHRIDIGDGEEFKSLRTFESVINELIAKKHNRTSTILALGGGVVGDLAGFVAASYQRGIRYVQVPTTLLAQVDSSVGGKTAVNHKEGKNLIGAFYQPSEAVIDVSTLTSLPLKTYLEGLAEVIKYGVIYDREFFDWLESNRQSLLNRDHDALVSAITRSCQIKAEVVEIDERESGLRAILNFGHTFGHAIETYLGYGKLLHGEAVAIGMCLAANLSARIKLCSWEDAERVQALVESYNLPINMPPDLEPDAMIEIMKLDKKVRDERIRFVLMKSIGDVCVTDEVSSTELRTTLQAGSAFTS